MIKIYNSILNSTSSNCNTCVITHYYYIVPIKCPTDHSPQIFELTYNRLGAHELHPI